MSRLSTVFLGVALAAGLALPATPALAGEPRPFLVARKDKKAKKAPKPPALEKGMKVVTMGDAVIVDDPSEEGEEVGRVAEGQVLTIVRLKKGGAWVRVKGPDGSQGWLRAAEVVPKAFYDAQGQDDERDAEPRDEDDEDAADADDEDDDAAAKKSAKAAKDKKDRKDKKGKKAKKVEPKDDDDAGDDEDGDDDDEKADDDDEKADNDGDDGDDGDDDDGGSAGVVARATLDGKWRFAGGAQLMYLSRAQEFTSGGASALSNYELTNGSPAIGVVGRVGYMMGKLELGGELGVSTTFGNEGVTIEGMGEPLAWSEQQVDARLLGGYHVAPGYVISARAGYRILATTIDRSDVIKQPSERLTGVALGLEATAYALYPKLEVRAGFETLVAAEVVQTAGYKDGDEAEVSPFYLFVEGGYLVAPKIQAFVGYTLSVETYTFAGVSERDPANTDGQRKDLQHLLSLGAQYWF